MYKVCIEAKNREHDGGVRDVVSLVKDFVQEHTTYRVWVEIGKDERVLRKAAGTIRKR